jgi:hypothetical protein
MQILAAALLAACGGGADTPAMLSNGVNVPQEARAQSCDFSQAQVMVNELRIRQVDANDIVVTFPEPRPIDLLDPGTGVLEALQTAPLTRDAIDVRLRASDGTLRFADGTVAPLNVPGNLRLTGDFHLAAGMVADLVVQGFDRCNAIHAAGNSGQFVLRGGDVPVQLLALPFVSDREQPAAGSLHPIPGDGYATVSSAVTGSFTIQRFNAYGQMQDGAIHISLPGNATSANVTPLANGGVLATWLGPATDPGVPIPHFPLMVQRFAADGSAQGAPVQVALTQPFKPPDNVRDINAPSLPQVAALADGGAALVWVQVDANGALNLYLERFAADGSAPSGAQRVNVASGGALPNVVGLSGGRVLVAWGKGPLFARVFEANGSAGAEQAIAPAAESLFGPPRLAALANGGAAVAWGSAVAGRFSVITRLVLAPDGTPFGPQQLFSDGSSPSIAGLADGGFVIAWLTDGSAHARRFGPDASQLGTQFISTSPATAGPSVVALPWGGFLVGWPAVTNGNRQDLMRFFDAQGLLGS